MAVRRGLKRPASNQTSYVARRPAAASTSRKRPAAAQARKRLKSSTAPNAVWIRASRAVPKGCVVFQEVAAAAAQTPRKPEAHLDQQPLFCSHCCSPVGPPEASLALVAGRVSREELLEFARHSDGDGPGLLRWLDFASKTPSLPPAPCFHSLEAPSPAVPVFALLQQQIAALRPTVADASVTNIPLDHCFCSAGCRNAWISLNFVAGFARDGVQSGLFCSELRNAWVALLVHAASDGISEFESILLLAARCVMDDCLRDVQGSQPAAPAVPAAAATITAAGSLAGMASTAIEPALSVREVCRVLGPHQRNVLPLALVKQAHKLLCRVLFLIGHSGKTMPSLAAYRRLVDTIELRGWAMTVGSMPSALGQYCETFFPAGTPPAARARLASVVGPIVRALVDLDACSEESEASEPNHKRYHSIRNSEEESVLGISAAIALLAPEDAKHTAPVLFRRVFDDHDVQAIKAVSSDFAGREQSKHETDCQKWRTRYLHAGGHFKSKAPQIMQKLVDLAIEADRAAGWGMLNHPDKPPCTVAQVLRTRCVEHHMVKQGGALPDPTHFDGGSVFTVDVMLSKPGVDFQGGTFSTLESDGSYAEHFFEQGDVLVFLSHKAHCVQPVTAGLRETLIMELWEGEERQCDHRCPEHRGPCPMEEARSGEAGGRIVLGSEEACETNVGEQRVHPDEGGAYSIIDIERDATRVFAVTSFEGLAFFPRVALVSAQSESDSAEGPNVEVLFEHVAPIATVRALRDINAGDVLICKPAGESSDEGTEAEESGEESEAS